MIARTPFPSPAAMLKLWGVGGMWGPGASLNPMEADEPKHVLLIWGPQFRHGTYHKGTAGQCPALSKGCPLSQGN